MEEGDTGTPVSLRDHLVMLLAADRRTNRERSGFVVAFGLFVWFEIQRRLENLNHENARILAAQERSVSADTYVANEEQRKKEAQELSAWRQGVDRLATEAVTRDEFQRDTKTDKRASIGSVTAVVAAVATTIVVVLGILNYQAFHHPVVTTTITMTTTVTTSP